MVAGEFVGSDLFGAAERYRDVVGGPGGFSEVARL